MSSGTAAVGVSSRHVRGKAKPEEFVVKRLIIGGVRGRHQTHGENCERA